MALTPRSGFSSTTSAPNVVPTEIPNTQSDVLNNMAYVTDPNLNKFAIDTISYPNAAKLMLGLMKGKRVNVTYYRLMRQGGSNNRTNIADYVTTRNVIDTEYQKIINLEITLPKGLDFEANPDRASIGVTGEAMFYPNMNPNVGDIFSMGVGDGRVGVFQVSATQPMSWRQDRVYTVKFVMQSFMDSSDADPIEGSVTLTHVFSKENYLGGTAALLSEQSYLQLNQLKAQRGVLLRYYHDTFFDPELCSYVRPDGVYDPYAVKFMCSKITMEELHIRPKQLCGGELHDYTRTVWGRLEDRYNASTIGLHPTYTLARSRQNRMGVFNSELFGRSVVVPGDATDGDPYLFTHAFYTGTENAMTPIELRVRRMIMLRTAGDLTSLLADFLSPVYTLSADDQYYRIPVYLHLIDLSLQTEYREIDAPGMNYTSTSG